MKKIEKYYESIEEFLEYVKRYDKIFIQPHNFPDHDAIASSFALQKFFEKFGMYSEIIYDGEIQRNSLKDLIKKLDIKLKHITTVDMDEDDKIIIVDGCKGNKNVTDFVGDEIAVIDHHNVKAVEDVEFCDIRSNYGACSTIIYEYYKQFNVEITQDVATALITGINFDTASLTRGLNIKDLGAYYDCFEKADVEYVNYLARNYISINDIQYYKELIEKIKFHENIAFVYFEDGCPQNMLGILSDFVLSFEEIDFVILCAKNEGRVNFSIRNQIKKWNASIFIQELLKGIGFGGGHYEMAGGVINNIEKFSEKEILEKSIEILNNCSIKFF